MAEITSDDNTGNIIVVEVNSNSAYNVRLFDSNLVPIRSFSSTSTL